MAKLDEHPTVINYRGRRKAPPPQRLGAAWLRQICSGHVGEARVRIVADSDTSLGFLAKERSLIWGLLRRKICISGPLRLMSAFGKCFPS
jgi:hypothetical protein